MDKSALVEVTLSLMSRYGIRVRDTYASDQPLELVWSDSELQACAKPGKVLVTPGMNSIGYASYRIVIPNHFKQSSRLDPVVHECVHYLQHQTLEEERLYFSAQPSEPVRYLQYLGQRVETEAHFIQLAYLLEKDGSGYTQSVLSEDTEAAIRAEIEECAAADAASYRRLQLVVRCKSLGLL